MPSVVVYVITYRRSQLLRRALSSIIAQTFRDWQALIINDDPEDKDVEGVVAELEDPRISLYEPVQHRGPTANFKIAFESPIPGYVSVLEDDNWWEPDFLAEMIAALSAFPEAERAVANERIWKEKADGWTDTGRTTMSHAGNRLKHFEPEDLCGSAVWCNSAMLVKTNSPRSLIPSIIPVDVSEHFFDRSMPGPIVQIGRALVNYAETITTARAESGNEWGEYQSLLVGSTFASIRSPQLRRVLARKLWEQCDRATSPRAVALVSTGIAMGKSRQLVVQAPAMSLARLLGTLARRPSRVLAMARLTSRFAEPFRFLCAAPLTQEVAQRFEREMREHP